MGGIREKEILIVKSWRSGGWFVMQKILSKAAYSVFFFFFIRYSVFWGGEFGPFAFKVIIDI